MRLIADLHIHSKYAYATSPNMDLAHLSAWAKIKGIDLLATGDFTHPLWFRELSSRLKERGDGFYEHEGVSFIPGTELSCIYRRFGRVFKVHNLVFLPDLRSVEKLNGKLAAYGKLASDGRPTLRLDSEDLVKLVLDISADGVVIPSHAWTPHFGVFGSKSGFDRLEDCFGGQTEHIFALETGLSSDPAMNWRLSALDGIALISNSDAHSPENLGREANIFDLPSSNRYRALFAALRKKDPKRFLSTIEFFPEEGKYHFDGHRACGARLSPDESRKRGALCPVCGKPVTVGVMNRVDELSDGPDGRRPAGAIPFRKIIPLREIIAEALGTGKTSKKVAREYDNIVNGAGSEFAALLDTPADELRRIAQPRIAEGILKVRRGELEVAPGYDGEYGSVHIHW